MRRLNTRKLQGIYWSFRQFGPDVLSSEYVWFVLAAVKSVRVATIDGGMTVVFKHLLSYFFEDGADISSGVIIKTASHAHMILALISRMVSDEAALKAACGFKGSSGSLLCLCCRNATSHKSRKGQEEIFHEHDTTGFLVPLVCTLGA